MFRLNSYNANQMADSNLFLNLFRHKEGKHYAAGQTIIEAGTQGSSMYVVLNGEVEIHVGSGAEPSVGGPGTIFGEMALIDETRAAQRLSQRRIADYWKSTTGVLSR